MKIVADENIPFIREVFAGLGRVETYAGRSISAEHVKDADVLLVRSVTKVNESLLSGSSIKFVGTCTIGTDHVDNAYLDKHGVAFSAAPGCNANAVVDYVISTLVVLSQGGEYGQSFDLLSRCVGIVGVGNVGRRLKSRLEAMGVRCLYTDPLHDDEEVLGMVHLEELLAEADIISLHVPLTTSGAHPTYHLLNAGNLAQLKQNTLLINTARGPVVDNKALADVLAKRPDMSAVLDVWEHEPEVDLELLSRVALSTPHIAGYSLDGKIRGTEMIYQALCQAFNLPVMMDVMSLAPAAAAVELINSESGDLQKISFDAVLDCYDVRRDDQDFRDLMTADNDSRAISFDELRKNYPVRRELGVTAVAGAFSHDLKSALVAIGFEA